MEEQQDETVTALQRILKKYRSVEANIFYKCHQLTLSTTGIWNTTTWNLRGRKSRKSQRLKQRSLLGEVKDTV